MPTFNSFSFQMPETPRHGQGMPQPFPDALAGTRPVLQVRIEIPLVLAQALQKANAPIPPPIEGFALIDTGASISSIDAPVFRQLDINQNGRALVGTAGGQQQQFTYPARLSFPGTGLPILDHSRLLGCDLVWSHTFRKSKYKAYRTNWTGHSEVIRSCL